MSLGGGVAGERNAVAMQSDLDALDLVRRQIVIPSHRDQRVERRMGVTAARIWFYADLHGLVSCAELRDRLVGMAVVAIADQEAVLALHRFGCSNEIVARQR